MKNFSLSILLMTTVLLVGCSALPGQGASEPTAVPLVTQAPGVVSEGRLVPNKYVNLSFNMIGTVSEVLVEEGEAVQGGQVIAHLNQSVQLSAAVANAETELLLARQALKDLNDNADVITAQALKRVADAREGVRQAERRLNNLNTGSPQTDINSASANVVILKDRLDRANKDFASYENKPEDNLKRAELLSKLADAQKKYDNAVRLLNNLQGSASDIDLAVADANLSLSQAELDLAEQEYEKVKNGPDPDDLAAAQARLKAAETSVGAAQAAYDDSQIKAPFSGAVAKLNLKQGEQVAPGATAAVLADFSSWIVETDDLTEIEVPKIQPGDQVHLTFDALPGLELGGVVESISGIDEEKHGDVTYTTRIRLTEEDARLRWGMTAVAHIPE